MSHTITVTGELNEESPGTLLRYHGSVCIGLPEISATRTFFIDSVTRLNTSELNLTVKDSDGKTFGIEDLPVVNPFQTLILSLLIQILMQVCVEVFQGKLFIRVELSLLSEEAYEILCLGFTGPTIN